MFKNISVKKAKNITAIICFLIGIIYCIVSLCTNDNHSSFDAVLEIMTGMMLSVLLYMIIFIFVFRTREKLENDISYAKSFLSKEEYKEINLKLEDNEFTKFSIEESPIRYYAKIKSDYEIEISIRKDEKEISNKIIDVYDFKCFFTA